MTSQTLPYIQRKAGDPWTVEDFHDLQTKVQTDIQDSIDKAIEKLDHVKKAGDAENFGGKNPDEYAKAIVDRVLAELPKRSGHMMLFKDLKLQEEYVVEHNLGAFPLVDLYQLNYFRVICSEDEHIYETFTTFYLYHSGESKIRYRPEETSFPSVSAEIDPPDGHVYRIPFQRMLELYEVKYDDDSSLNDLETDFWKAFFSDPNDEFDDDQYCHSPWFDRCCREMRTVRYLKDRNEWDDMWFQVRPIKTVNYHAEDSGGDQTNPPWVPNNIGVMHFDLNTLGLKLLEPTQLPQSQTKPPPLIEQDNYPTPDAVENDHQKVLVLLKV